MTPFNTKKSKQKIYFLISLVSVVIIGGWMGVSKYVACVGLTHDVHAFDKKIEEIKVHNADLKSLLYKQTDATSLEVIAQKKGLVQDKNPQWAFVSVY
ncbi:MAG: hypothetical protein V1652_02670 [bacterium]